MSLRVVVTRPAREAQLWVRELSAAGLTTLALPLIDIRPTADVAPLVRAWTHIRDYVAVMFVSANAVEGFFASFAAPGSAALGAARAWATGPGTAQALQRAGVSLQQIDAPTLDAAQFDSEALWARVSAQVRAGQRVLIVRGDDAPIDGLSALPGNGRDWLATRLREAGVPVDVAVAYQRACPNWDAAQQQLAQRAAIDGSIWLFSSSAALKNLDTLLPAQDWSRARAIATHARIAQAVRQQGWGVVGESRPTLADVLASIKSLA